MILGFDLEITRVALVAVLGGLLGILMMIPLRRALIVDQHGILKYPEGTACAEVLKAAASREGIETQEASEENVGGGKTIFAGFGLGFLYYTAMEAFKSWKEVPEKVFGAPFRNRKSSTREGTEARKAAPDKVWHATQWQTVTRAGSTSAS